MQNEAAEAKVLAEIDSVVGDRVPSEWASLLSRQGVITGVLDELVL